MSDSTQILRAAIRSILAEGDIPKSQAIKVGPIRGTYAGIQLPSKKFLVGAAAAAAYEKAAQTWSTGMGADNDFPISAISKADPVNDAAIQEDLEKLAISGYTHGVPLYGIIDDINLGAWPDDTRLWNALSDDQKDYLKSTLSEIYGKKYGAFLPDSFISSLQGGNPTRQEFFSEIKKFVDYSHSKFQDALDSIDAPASRAAAQKEKDAYDVIASKFN